MSKQEVKILKDFVAYETIFWAGEKTSLEDDQITQLNSAGLGEIVEAATKSTRGRPSNKPDETKES